ncbi:hypothetical protein SRHO_G00115690 [Serrasalmus rhombeus]
MLSFFILVCIFICLVFLFIQRPKNFPPGPWPVPIFRKLFQLNIMNPLKDIEKLAERFGNVYSLYLGGSPAVVLTGLKAVKEALVIKAADFSPQNLLVSHTAEGNERCQKEIDEVLEGKAHASFDDRHKMPYMEAVIHECHRIANTVPLSLFHCTSRDTELMGYSIPKETLIIRNLSSVLSEEGQWKFPHEFNPANFLNEQGQFEKPETFIPFSAGESLGAWPRICLGEGLAHMELFLILVSLLCQFQFVWPEDAGEPDFTPVYGITLAPKPYRMGVRLKQTA